MSTFLPKVSLTLATLSLLTACGMETTANYRTPTFDTQLDAKAVKPNAVLINFTLPDRTSQPEYKSLSGYYYRLVGEGAACPTGEVIEEVGTWEDANNEVKFQVNGKCNYAVTVRYGVIGAASGLALGSTINWTDDIKPIIQSNCASCHENYLDYATVVQEADDIIRQIEAGTMPKIAPLAVADVAKFLGWKDGGFEQKTAVVLPSEKEKALSEVYYENNRNDYLMSYEIISRSTYELRRSLWIQPDGEKAGLSVKEVSTWAPKTSQSTTP